jgi:pyruvate dehydrogenase E1 component
VNDVRFVGSESILPQVMEAAQRSATSSSELARDAREVGPRNRLNPLALPEISHVAGSLGGNTRPIVAAADSVRGYPKLMHLTSARPSPRGRAKRHTFYAAQLLRGR